MPLLNDQTVLTRLLTRSDPFDDPLGDENRIISFSSFLLMPIRNWKDFG